MSQLMDAALEGATLMNIYLVQEKLGKGGMAWVYKGIHQRLQSPIAIKILASIVASDPDVKTRFLREARLQFGLQHTNIVRVIDMVEEGDLCGIVMEWCDGGDLHEWFHRRGRPIGAQHVRAYFLPLLDALSMAHARGIVHRDLKPRNILLSSTPTGLAAKLTDFGIAKALDEESHTVTGATIGTLRYIAPEQLIDSKHVDHRADIYSFGVMLYFLLTGRPPFLGPGHAIVHQILNEPVPEPVEAPLPLQAILMRCLAKHPDDRFVDCMELHGALQAALARIPESDIPLSEDSDHFSSPGAAGFGPRNEHLTTPHAHKAGGVQTVSHKPHAPGGLYLPSRSSDGSVGPLPSSDSLSGAGGERASSGLDAEFAQASSRTVPMKAPSIEDFAAIQEADRAKASVEHPMGADDLPHFDGQGGPPTTPMSIPSFATEQGGAAHSSTKVSPKRWKWLALSLLLALAAGCLAWVFWWRHPAQVPTTTSNKAALVPLRGVPADRALKKRKGIPVAMKEISTPPSARRTGLVPARRTSLSQSTDVRGGQGTSPPSIDKPQRPPPRRRGFRARNARKVSRLRTRRGRRAKVRRSARRKTRRPIHRQQRGAPYQFRPLKQITRYMTIEAKAADVLRATGRLPNDPANQRERRRVREHLCKIGFGRACGIMALVRPIKDFPRSIALTKRGCELGCSWSCVHWGLMYAGYWDRSEHLRDAKKACRILELACQRKSRWGCGQYNHHRCGGEILAPFPRARQDTTYRSPPAFRKKRSFRITAQLVYEITKLKRGNTVYREMMPWLEQACELGVGGACWARGIVLQYANKYQAAYVLLQRGCRLMNGNSCSSLGLMEAGSYKPYQAFTNLTRACIHLQMACQLKTTWGCNRRYRLNCPKP